MDAIPQTWDCVGGAYRVDEEAVLNDGLDNTDSRRSTCRYKFTTQSFVTNSNYTFFLVDEIFAMPLFTFHAVQKMLFQIFLVLQFIPMIWTAHQPPTLVLIPGAWHSPIHYSLLLAEIEKAGYPTSSARSPSCGSTDPYSQSCHW